MREHDIPRIPITRHWPDRIYYRACVSIPTPSPPPKPRTYVATSKIQYAQPRGSLGEPVFIVDAAELPRLALAYALASQMQRKSPVSGLLTRFSSVYGLRHAGTEPDFRVKAKHPYGLVARAASRGGSMLLACKRAMGASARRNHARVTRIFRPSFRASVTSYASAEVYVEVP